MLGWFRAQTPEDERDLVSRARRGSDEAQKALLEMSEPPRGRAKGVGELLLATRAIAPFSFAPTRRFA
jgi:hypothetical protein